MVGVLVAWFWVFTMGVFACGDCGTCDELASVTFDLVRSTISADTLVSLINSGISMALLEYRSRVQNSNIGIPNSIVIYDDENLENLTKILDAELDLVVVYPGVEGANIASLTAKIREIGFDSILEFNDGVQGWLTYGYEWVENN